MDPRRTQSAADAPVGRYGRKIGFFSLVALLFAALCSGPGSIEEIVAASGPGIAMWLFILLPIVWGLPNVLVNAELSSAIPIEGGYYRWCRRALGPFWGFVSGWWVWMGSIFDNVVYPVILVEYAAVLWPALEARSARAAAVVGLIAVFGYLNYRGIRTVAFSSAIFTVLVMLPWVVFVVLGLPLARRNPFEPLVEPGRAPVEGLGVALVVAMWFFAGYELPSTAAEEYEDSRRNLPRALAALLVLSALAYLLPLAVGLAVSDDWASWENGSLVHVGRQIGEAWAGHAGGLILGAMITVGVAFAMAALFNGLLVPNSRIPLVMAEEGDLPRALAMLHPRHRTPWVAILLNCALYAALHWLDFSALVLLSMWNALIAYFVVDATLIALRIREPDLPRPVRIPFGKAGLVLVIAPLVIITVWAIVWSVRENVLEGRWHVLALGFAGILSGPVIYVVRAIVRRVRA